MPLKEQINKVKACSEAQLQIYVSIVMNYCIALEGSSNKEVVNIFDQTYAAHAYNAINYQLITSVIKDCSELLFGKDKKSPSVLNILSSLDDVNIFTFFEELFSHPLQQNWIGVIPPKKYQERDFERRREERRSIFLDAARKLRNKYATIVHDPAIKKLKKLEIRSLRILKYV